MGYDTTLAATLLLLGCIVADLPDHSSDRKSMKESSMIDVFTEKL